VELIEAWLRADITLKGTVVHERLVASYGFRRNYQTPQAPRTRCRMVCPLTGWRSPWMVICRGRRRATQRAESNYTRNAAIRT
jgi:hypothetical protein